MCPLAFDQGDDAIDEQTGNGVEHPNEDADDDAASNDDQSVVDDLLLAGPNNLLELAAHFAEPALHTCEQVRLNVSFCHFLFTLSALDGLSSDLLRLVVHSVLSAESAVLLHFKTIGVILLVLDGVVVSLLALGASESDLNAHFGTSYSLPPCMAAG